MRPHEPLQVERAILRRVTIPLVEPFRISNGSVAEKESIVIECHASGAVGYGEASPMSGSFYSSETPETTMRALSEDLIPALLAAPITSGRDYALTLHDYQREPFARAGVEGAVWHLIAEHERTSIGSLFGATALPVPSGLAVGIYDTTDELLDRIERHLREGYQRVKVKIMPGWDDEPLTAVRKRFPNMPLMVDANASYRWPEHRETLIALDQYDLMMIEQPLGTHDLPELAEMRGQLRTKICVDESAESLSALDEMIRLGSCDIVNIKVQRVGGLLNATEMLHRARAAGLACWLGTMPELGIASAQALQIATLPGFDYPTDIESSARWFVDDLLTPAMTVDPSTGCITTPRGGAIGYTIDTAKLDRFTTERREFTQ